MAKVYRVLTLSESAGGFCVVDSTKWGSELGKARATMNEIMDKASDKVVVAIDSMEAPATREEFVAWLNGTSPASVNTPSSDLVID